MKTTIRLITTALLFLGIGLTVGHNYVKPRIQTIVKFPDHADSRLIHVGDVDFKFVWFPWGVYTVEELKARYFIDDAYARMIIREATCQ